MNGKGSRRRPMVTSSGEFCKRWATAFGPTCARCGKRFALDPKIERPETMPLCNECLEYWRGEL